MKLSVDQFKGDERKHFSKQQVMNIMNLLPKKRRPCQQLCKRIRESHRQQSHEQTLWVRVGNTTVATRGVCGEGAV